MSNEEASQEEPEFSQEESEQDGETFGFQAMEEPSVDEEKRGTKRPREDTEEMKQLKREILRYVGRYPTLELRSSKQITDRLDQMTVEELRIVRDNCVTDLSDIRGAPVASFAVFCMSKPFDAFLPGYSDQCLQDTELKRDVESEIIAVLGEMGNKVNIFFRLLNNAYITWKRQKHFTNQGFDLDAETTKKWTRIYPPFAGPHQQRSEEPQEGGEEKSRWRDENANTTPTNDEVRRT